MGSNRLLKAMKACVCVCVCVCVCMCARTRTHTQSRLTLCNPSRLLWAWDFPGKNTAEGAISSPRVSSWPRDGSPVPCISCTGQVGSLPAGPSGKPNESICISKDWIWQTGFFQKILWFAITNFVLSWLHVEINFNLQNLLGYGIELHLPNRYVEMLPPYTSECNLLWKQWCGICN